jgi:cyclophilin family peptidyl-prolyl cis-trans isomerase
MDFCNNSPQFSQDRTSQTRMSKSMLPTIIRALFSSRNGRRRGYHTKRNACLEVLETRRLLSATNTATMDDINVDREVITSLTLSDYFDDPAIAGSVVKVDTPLGHFFVETYDDVTPLTVQNFLTLIDGQRYRHMFFHRSAPGFVIQGGGYTYAEGATGYDYVEDAGTVVNEFSNWFDPELGGLQAGTPLNLRGTIAMAKLGGDPDSATSEWFVSLADNSGILDPQNGGFTVFAHVLFDGMTVVDSIAQLSLLNAGGAFTELPLRDYTGGPIVRDHLVTTSMSRVSELSFQITANSNPELLSIDIVNGELQITPIEGQTGSTTITVSATDLLGNTVTDALTLTVADNTIPVVTIAQAEQNSARPTFQWTAVTGYDTYELWVNQLGGTNAIIHENNVAATSFTAAVDLPEGTYRVWVRAHGQGGTSAWSQFQTFAVGTPVVIPSAVTITQPTGHTDSLQPLIEWTAADGTEFYDLWVNQIGGQSQIIRQESLTSTSFQPTTDLAAGSYRAWIQPRNAAGRAAWSSAVTFEIGGSAAPPPVITGPARIVTDGRSSITWDYANNLAVFEFWLNEIGGQARLLHDTQVAQNSFTPPQTLADGSYRVWVRDVTPGQAKGPWSDAYDFTVASVAAPGIVASVEVNADSTPRPTFMWLEASNAAQYELWVNQVGGQTRIIHTTTLTGLQFTATEDLPTGNYRAWLRAYNSGGVAGLWTSVVNFVIS